MLQTEYILTISASISLIATWITVLGLVRKRADKDARLDERLKKVEEEQDKRKLSTNRLYEMFREIQNDIHIIKGKLD